MFAGWYVVGGIISKGVTLCVIITGKFKQSEIFDNGSTFFEKMILKICQFLAHCIKRYYSLQL